MTKDRILEHLARIPFVPPPKLRNAHAQTLAGAEREEAYSRVASQAPRYGEYPKKTDRVIPVIRLTPASGS